MATPTFVGDAGVHKDPFLALGICDGGRDAEFLADAVRKGLMAIGRWPMRGQTSSVGGTTRQQRTIRTTSSVRDPEAATMLVKRRMEMIPATN